MISIKQLMLAGSLLILLNSCSLIVNNSNTRIQVDEMPDNTEICKSDSTNCSRSPRSFHVPRQKDSLQLLVKNNNQFHPLLIDSRLGQSFWVGNTFLSLPMYLIPLPHAIDLLSDKKYKYPPHIKVYKNEEKYRYKETPGFKSEQNNIIIGMPLASAISYRYSDYMSKMTYGTMGISFGYEFYFKPEHILSYNFGYHPNLGLSQFDNVNSSNINEVYSIYFALNYERAYGNKRIGIGTHISWNTGNHGRNYQNINDGSAGIVLKAEHRFTNNISLATHIVHDVITISEARVKDDFNYIAALQLNYRIHLTRNYAH